MCTPILYQNWIATVTTQFQTGVGTCCRLKASLERLQRLTQGYTDALLDVFPARAAALGKGLGLPEEPVQAPPPLTHTFLSWTSA